MKETANLFGHVVSSSWQVPSLADASEPWVLSGEKAKEIGDVFLHSILTLKHLGAVEAAGDGFRRICQHLLTLAKSNSELCALPSKWLALLLMESRFKDTEFVLRRSRYRNKFLE